MSKAQSDQASKRASYRIVYPVGDRPFCTILGTKYSVLNLSEEGVLLQVVQGFTLNVGDDVSGSIQFADGIIEPIRGSILRRDFGKVALQLTTAVSLKTILNEQRRLIKKHGKLRQVS